MLKMSKEHILFLKEKKKEKRMIHSFRILIFLTFLFLWELLTRINLLNPFLFSSPSRIVKTTINLFMKNQLLFHIGITLWEVFLSFVLSFFLGLLIAYFLWRYPILSKIVDPYLMILNSLPKVALGPLIIIWMGARIHSIIFMSLTISLFSTIINLYEGFHTVHKNELLLLKSFHASTFQIFFKLILPSNLLTIISTLKINISMSFIGVIMGELLVSKMGLGYLIMYGSQIFQLDLVLTSIVILGTLSYLFFFVLDLLQKRMKKKRN